MKDKTAVEQTNQLPTLGLARRTFLLGLCAVVSATGCKHITRRGQSPDENSFMSLSDSATQETRYVGEVTGVWGMNYAAVEGIGLVGALEGTGSNPTPGWQLDHLAKELRTREEIENPKTLLADSDTSMAMVKGLLPPGIRKGERFDLQVRTHPKSDTVSLFGGLLNDTRLKTMAVLGRRVREGKMLGAANGPVLIDALFESRQDQSNQVRGWIPGGGIAYEDRPLGLSIRTEGHSFRTATSIAAAINDRFTTIDNHGRIGVATAKSDKLIELLVPSEYKHNVSRFMTIVRNIAFEESVSERVERLSQLDQELNDPALSGTAAVRLEAMGSEGVPALTRALRHPDLEVRFHAANALAYLGEASGVVQLQEAAEIEPAFRWHALTALATLDESTSLDALKELMHVESAETRYGAFRSLYTRAPHDPAVLGEMLMNEFSLHVVPSKTDPMLHVARSKRAEIVLFGEGQSVGDNILYVKSGLTIKGDGNGGVKIIRYLPGRKEIRKTCSTQLAELIPILAQVGCNYSMLVELLRDAQQNDMLQTRLVMDATPKRKRNYSGSSTSAEKSNRYISEPVPTLFRAGEESDNEVPRDDIAQLTSSEDKKSGTRTGALWTKMNNPLQRRR